MRPSFNLAILRNLNPLVCVEIGVRAGYNAFDMLSSGRVGKIYLIDPYRPYFDDEEEFTRQTQCKFLKVALDRLEKFWESTIWMVTDSENASKMLDNISFDYVYIDGRHDYESVKQDIDLWYPRVKKGGILAGHDYIDKKEGLRRAVDEFAKKKDLILCIDETDWILECR